MKLTKSPDRNILTCTLGRKEYVECGASREALGPSQVDPTPDESQAWDSILKRVRAESTRQETDGWIVSAPAFAGAWTIAESRLSDESEE